MTVDSLYVCRYVCIHACMRGDAVACRLVGRYPPDEPVESKAVIDRSRSRRLALLLMPCEPFWGLLGFAAAAAASVRHVHHVMYYVI